MPIFSDLNNGTRWRILVCGLFLAVSLSPVQLLAQADWTQWRGTKRTGHVTGTASVDQWPARLERIWSLQVGEGHGSPVASSDRAFVMTRQGELETVVGVDLRNGAVAWTDSYPVEIGVNPSATAHGKWPRSTPLWNGGHLYTLGITGALTAYDSESGRRIWRRDFSEDVDVSNLFCGTSMSPLLAAGKLIVHVGDDSGGEVLALDPLDGSEIWSWKGDGPGYASPVIVDLDGTSQIVTLTKSLAIGLDLESGNLLWSLAFDDEWNENIVTPVSIDGRVLFSGVRKGTFAVLPQRESEGWVVDRVWENGDVPLYMSSPVIDSTRLFGLTSRKKGQVFSMDPRDGKVLWTSPGRAGRSAAFIVWGQHLLIQTTEAQLIILERGANEYKPIAEYDIANTPTWAHPAIVDGKILVKDQQNLTLWKVQ